VPPTPKALGRRPCFQAAPAESVGEVLTRGLERDFVSLVLPKWLPVAWQLSSLELGGLAGLADLAGPEVDLNIAAAAAAAVFDGFAELAAGRTDDLPGVGQVIVSGLELGG